MSRRPAKPKLSNLARRERQIVKPPLGGLPSGYAELLEGLKSRIRTVQVRAALSVNRELIQLYWSIGGDIVERQRTESWGAGVIDRLAADIQREFPGLAGFSRANIYRMRAFYLAYPQVQAIVSQAARQTSARIVSQGARQSGPSALPEPVASLPWFHNVVLLESLKDPHQRLWYAKQAVEHGWSRSMLVHWIESDLYSRQGKAVTNFPATLPPAQSDLAAEIVKDPYSFDFLTLASDAAERELERALLDHVRQAQGRLTRPTRHRGRTGQEQGQSSVNFPPSVFSLHSPARIRHNRAQRNTPGESAMNENRGPSWAGYMR